MRLRRKTTRPLARGRELGVDQTRGGARDGSVRSAVAERGRSFAVQTGWATWSTWATTTRTAVGTARVASASWQARQWVSTAQPSSVCGTNDVTNRPTHRASAAKTSTASRFRRPSRVSISKCIRRRGRRGCWGKRGAATECDVSPCRRHCGPRAVPQQRSQQCYDDEDQAKGADHRAPVGRSSLTSWLTFDADLAYSHARFRNYDPVGSRIPGAPEGVASLGLSTEHRRRLSGSIRLRYFGPRPLIEDDSVRSRPAAVLSAQIAHRLSSRFSVALDVFNLTNARVSDVDYYYVSRLPGEPAAGVADVHTHPLESRSLRAGLTATF